MPGYRQFFYRHRKHTTEVVYLTRRISQSSDPIDSSNCAADQFALGIVDRLGSLVRYMRKRTPDPELCAFTKREAAAEFRDMTRSCILCVYYRWRWGD